MEPEFYTGTLFVITECAESSAQVTMNKEASIERRILHPIFTSASLAAIWRYPGPIKCSMSSWMG